MIKVGDEFTLSSGEIVKVIKYNKYTDIDIKLSTGEIVNVIGGNLVKGYVRNRLYPNVYGKGYLGIGEHKVKVGGKKTKTYEVWNGMLERCYSERYQKTKPTYRGCSVDESWLNFQNFGDWFVKNYVEGYQLDKDLLVRGNKVYSEKTCIFVPLVVNCFMTESNATRGKYLIVVTFSKNNKLFAASINNPFTSKSEHLGNFNDEYVAHSKWLERKLELAKGFKDIGISDKIVDALIHRYENYNLE